MVITLNESQILKLGLIVEDKLLGSNVIDDIIKKIGGDSSTAKKLQILALHRNSYPFNIYLGDIKKDITSPGFVNQLYTMWKDVMLNRLYDDYLFVSDHSKAEKYLDMYIDSIVKMGDKALPLPKKRLGDFIVNYLNDNNLVDVNVNNLYNPLDEDILFEDDEVIILRGTTQNKCTMYSGNEKWCINRGETGYFIDFVDRLKAKIYFVLQKNVKGGEHKLVLIRFSDGLYSIADRTNSSDNERAGLYAHRMKWSKLEQIVPNLSGLEGYLK